MSWPVWSLATIATFYAARWVYVRTKQPLLHPVLWGSAALVVALELTGRPYAAYWRETQWLVWLLGPGVVALAVPVYRLRALIAANFRLLLAVVLAGLFFSLASTAGVLVLFGVGRAVWQALALKSITAAVAFAIAREVNALPMLAGVGTMVAALLGATLGPWVLARAGVRDPRAIGLGLGCGSHMIGTVRAFELGEEPGTFASVGMALTALAAALICPPLFLLLS
ncbi:MAG: LrgB family protein [Opitutae bacterium]|nr:LrgB family protein [Opitutae bacterium]